MPLRIYLDTNHWIKLFAIDQGKEGNKEFKKLFIAIKKLTKSSKIQVLFSAYTLSEISKHADEEKQGNLIDLIIDISRGYVLKPHIYFQNREIENAFLIILGKEPIHDIYSQIIGKGLADIYDYSFEEMNRKNPHKWNKLKNNPYGLSEDYFKKKFQKENEDLEVMKKYLKSKESVKVAKKALSDSTDYFKNFEETRFKNSTMSKEKFFKYVQFCDLKNSVFPHLSKFLVSNGMGINEILFLKDEEKTSLFKKYLNSFNVSAVLCSERDYGVEKPILANDAYDVAHLAGAIPYCDIVVTDKMFARLSTNKKLDQIYNCKILDDLALLSNIEPIKSKIKKLEII